MTATFDLAKEILDHRARYVYTYPFKGAYRPLVDHDLALDDWAYSDGPLNVYVHVPYCDMKCGFCNLLTTTRHTPDSIDTYADSVRREINILAESGRFSNYRVKSVYFGGGTPTAMRPRALDAIVQELQVRIPHSVDCELAIESAPGSADKNELKQLRATGFRRISFGVQSFLDEELTAMGRNHTAYTAVHAVEDAHAVDFENVNVDLIYGLNNQTLSAWERSLSAAVRVQPETVTVYPLTFRNRTALGKRHALDASTFPTPPERSVLYEVAKRFLISNGYRQLTMVAFARQNGGNLHEQSEFLGVPTVGFGAGALSYGPNYHYTSGDYHDSTPHLMTIKQYLERVRLGVAPVKAGIHLDADEQMRRYLIMRLLSVGVAPKAFASRFGFYPEESYSDQLHSLRDHGLVELGADEIRLTTKGVGISSVVADDLSSERVRLAAASYS